MTKTRVTRAERDYGLPRLTVDEAARVLGVHRGEFWLWLVGELKPTPQQISKWSNDVEPLAEAILRLYLTRQRDAAPGAAPPISEASATPATEDEERRRLQRPSPRRRAKAG